MRTGTGSIEEYWQKFTEANTIDRQELIHGIADNLLQASMLPDLNLRRVCVETLLLSYLNDLDSYYKAKVRD